MAGRLRSRAVSVAGASVAPFAVLVTPFVIFLQYEQYPFLRAEVVCVVAILAALSVLIGACTQRSRTFALLTLAALLTWVADVELADPGLQRLLLLFIVLSAVLWTIREYAATIVSLTMLTVAGASLVSSQRPAVVTAAALPPSRANLPLIVHIVLDEHIGVEGLTADVTPAGMKHAVVSFFVDRGFRLFGNAYSERTVTERSLSQLLNFASGPYLPDLVGPGARPNTFRLVRNAYFARLHQIGYTVRVHQSNYVNLCDAGNVASCTTYDPTAVRVLDTVPATGLQKISVIGGAFLAHSDVFGRARQLYDRMRRRLAVRHLRLPRWNWTWDQPVVAPVAAMEAIASVRTDLQHARRGDAVFVHMLMPHYPYIYDESCRPRPPTEWLKRSDANNLELADGAANTREGRAIRYARYLQQTACVHRQIEELLTAIPVSLRQDAIVVVQGDHGSRIGLAAPFASARTPFSASDYADYFSTLFAVRSPRLKPAYDHGTVSITCLLRTLINSEFSSTDGADACSTSRTVFFRDETPHVLPIPDVESGSGGAFP
jgi:hypothetical protein